MVATGFNGSREKRSALDCITICTYYAYYYFNDRNDTSYNILYDSVAPGARRSYCFGRRGLAQLAGHTRTPS